MRARFSQHPHIGDIRGRGLFLGIELVADRDTKTPFAADRRLPARIKAAAMARGLMVYPMGGTIDGTAGAHILLAPPYIATETELAGAVDALTTALEAVLPATTDG